MKKSLIIAIIMMLVLTTTAFAWTSVTEGVDWKAGDAASECVQAGSTADFAYKVDNSAVNGDYTDPDTDNTFTISNSNGYIFDWASNWPVETVIVKASTKANLFFYVPAAFSDTGLYSVIKDQAVYDESGNLITPAKYYEISHVTFCYNEPDMCYEEETAWAEGARYVKKGNWAMYVDYYGVEKTVELIADYTNYVHAGTVTFSAPVDGKVTITVNLTGGAIFYYDLNDPLYDDNLKVQDYAKAPTKTPAPGLFAWKTHIATYETTGSIVVPVNNFYGVHLDIALPVPCE